MTLESYELRNPGQLIGEVADRVGLTVDHAYLVLVEDPPGDQLILGITELTSPALIEEYDDVIDELREVVDNLTIPEARRPPRHMVVTVLVRPGRCVFGPNEGRWMSAWRYSNHRRDVWDGEVILVTEHGWCDFMTDFAGHTPALAG